MNATEFLASLEGVKRSENGWTAKCPAHDDRHASLSVSEGDAGQILLKCHAGEGCSVGAICAELGLNVRDLYPDRDTSQNGRRVVATYDYEDEQGALIFQAVRYEPKQFLQRRPDGRGGWVWKTGSTRRVLYRLPRVVEAVTAGQTIYIVEGEKDVHALETAGAVATCNPMGAGKWRDAYSKVLKGADVVVVQDHDEEGRKHATKVAGSLADVAANVRIVEAAEGKDAADHLAAGLSTADFVAVGHPEQPESRKAGGEPASLSQKAFRNANLETTRKTPPPLAFERDIPALFLVDLARAGVAGEEILGQIVYLALTSRVLPWGKPTERPISTIAKGTSSTGKSHTVKTTLRFFPASAWLDLGSMSRKYLFYTEEDFSHRFIYVPEWASIKEDEELVALLRMLVSEGRIVHGTVDVERKAQLIEKDGPTGLLMTTTAAAVDSELETRCLSAVTDDSTEQTGRVFRALAGLERETESPVDFGAWQELQEWIAFHGETRVAIPFVDALAEKMPNVAPRLRRDFVTILCLVRAHAILHQATREKDNQGRILATIADYSRVRDLVSELIAEAADASASPVMRQTVDAVAELLSETGVEHISVKALTDRLAVGQSAAYDRVKRALTAGYLVNLSKKDERGIKLAIGAAMPGSEAFLPSPEEVFRVSSGAAGGNANPHDCEEPGEFSGIPGLPVDLLEVPEDAGPGGPDHDEWQDELDRYRELCVEPKASA